MKTLILFFVAIAISAFSQNTYYPTIKIIKADTTCNGSTLNVIFTFTSSNGSPGSTSTTQITMSDEQSNIHVIWQGDQFYFYTRPTCTVNGVACRIITYSIPNNLYYNSWTNFGHNIIYGTNGGTNLSFVNKNCSPTATVPTNTVGVSEYELDTVVPTYYDLQGNRIEKIYNQLIIEQVGSKRRKIIIPN